VIRTSLQADRFVRAVEFSPGTPRFIMPSCTSIRRRRRANSTAGTGSPGSTGWAALERRSPRDTSSDGRPDAGPSCLRRAGPGVSLATPIWCWNFT
jgi:hypothetical protein